MDKHQAQKTIKDTFERSFDMDRFTVFTKNLLNRIDESKAFHAHGYVKEGFRGIIKTYERVGTYNAPDDKKVDIIVVYLQKGSSLDHARVTQRNFAGKYLIDRGQKDAGLFAFISPDPADWRFSLVKMDYKFDKNGKVKEEFTPARRWSFLVGENEKSHTAQSRLVKILADDEHDPTLEEIEKSFDIETVTKEFFLKYRELFLRTKEELDRVVEKDPKIAADFEAKGVDTVNFAKKLLGQIIFLYFLQKKGWFGVGRDDDWGTGSKHFLRELFEKKHLSAGALAQAGGDYLPAPQSNAPRQAGNNFFNDILEPLFYEALRRDRSDDDGYYKLFDCKIPFLNGGLFDPIGNYDWVHTDILLPDKLFSNTNKTKQGDVGDGILDIFDRYNFTVKEDEPLEKEVAIDPELLGKAYEKFNAIRPDNFDEYKKALKSGKSGEENKFNKKFGVYPTPREIVHYMCQQSLINYLATELEGKAKKEAIEFFILEGEKYIEHLKTAKEKREKNANYQGDYKEKEHFIELKKHANEIDNSLSKIKVCDPAVGSGAFPVGMMTEIVKARMFFVETGCLEKIYINSHQEKVNRTPYNFKRDCIEYSLYGVDIDPGAVEIAKLRLWLSLIVDEQNIKNIKPLPNLDYRIMQGNSLISEFMGISFDEDENKNLKQNIDDLGIEIKELDKQIKDKEKQFLRYYNKTKKQDQNLSNKLDKLVSRKNDLKKNQTQLIKKLNNPQNEDPELIDIISEFQKKKNAFLNESNVTKKSQLKNEVNDLLVKIFETKLRTQKPDYLNRLKNIENKYSVIRNEKQRDELVKQDKEKLNKEFGFDLESAEKQLKEFTSGRKIKPFFLWNLYFSEVFLSGAKSASGGPNKGGFDVVIANPPYITIALGKKQKFFSDCEVASLKQIFKDVYEYKGNTFSLFFAMSIALLNEKGVLTFITPNTLLLNFTLQKTRKYILNNCNIQNLISITGGVFESGETGGDLISILSKGNDYENIVKTSEIKDTSAFNYKLKFNYIEKYLYNEIEGNKFYLDIYSLKLMKKIAKDTLRLGDIVKFYQGIITGDNNRFLSDKKISNKHYKILRGRDIYKYFYNFGSTYVLFDKKLLWSNTNKELFHVEEKLINRQTSSDLIAAYDNMKIFTLDSTHIQILKNKCFSLKYILALFNSKLLNFYYHQLIREEGRVFAQVKTIVLKTLPIKDIPIEQQQPFVSIVDRILTITKHNDSLKNFQKQAKVKSLERETDQLVYKLYDLTEEEIDIIEERI